jgi:hypothetical protein
MPSTPLRPLQTATPMPTWAPTPTPTGVTPTPTPTFHPTPTPTPTPTPGPTPNCNSNDFIQQVAQAAIQFVQMTVVYYKPDIERTKKNIYGESLEKWYYQPIVLRCRVDREPQTINDQTFGPDFVQNIKITTTQEIFQNLNMMPEVGDIIHEIALNKYYEVHNVLPSYIPVVSNTTINTNINCPQNYLVTYELDCHFTRVSRLNLSPIKLQ